MADADGDDEGMETSDRRRLIRETAVHPDGALTSGRSRAKRATGMWIP